MTTTNRRLIGQPAPAGMLNPSILDQTDIWQNIHGDVMPLDDMDTGHLKNLEPFLLKHGSLRWKWIDYQTAIHFFRGPICIGEDENGEAVETWGHNGAGFPLFSDGGGNLDSAFDEWMDHELTRPFDEWLADRPLVKRIRQIIADRPDRDGPTFYTEVPF